MSAISPLKRSRIVILSLPVIPAKAGIQGWFRTIVILCCLLVTFSATAQERIPLEACENPDTVFLDFPGILTNCEPGVGRLIIWNTTDVQRVSFDLANPLFSATAAGTVELNVLSSSNPNYNLDKSAQGGIDTYTVSAVSDVIGVASAELEVIVSLLSCDNPNVEPCECSIGSLAIVPVQADASNSENDEVGVEVLLGGVVSRLLSADTELFLLKGNVFYSDGSTPFPGAAIDRVIVDGGRIPEEIFLEDPSSDSEGRVLLLVLYIRTAGEVIRVRFCSPEECGLCSSYYEGPLSRVFGGARVKFFIPLDPPHPTNTPTTTNTPTITKTATVTPTFTPSNTRTHTPTPTDTATLTPTFTPTPTITDTLPPTFASERSDIDGDGDVDADDLLVLLNDWKKATGP